jgi:hypothetical protein
MTPVHFRTTASWLLCTSHDNSLLSLKVLQRVHNHLEKYERPSKFINEIESQSQSSSKKSKVKVKIQSLTASWKS